MDIGDLISVYRKEAKLTIEELSEKSGVPKGTLNKIIGGVTKAPTLDNIKSIAKALGKTLDDFDDTPSTGNINFSNDEIKHIKKYRALDSHGKEVVDVVLEKETERIEKLAKTVNDVPEEEADVIYIDFVEAKASAGKGFNLDEEYKEKLKLYVNRTTARADFAVMVAGNSMEPKFYDGDILLVSKQPDIEIGDFGIFVKNDKGYVKEKGADRLISLNENYPDIFPSEDEPIQCMGKVIGILDKKWIAE